MCPPLLLLYTDVMCSSVPFGDLCGVLKLSGQVAGAHAANVDTSTDALNNHHPDHLQTTFGTQARALFIKNAAQQRRQRRTNIILILYPVIFCILLYVLQRVINNALSSRDNQVGCRVCVWVVLLALWVTGERSGKLGGEDASISPSLPGAGVHSVLDT